jgi:hypothetical protein
MHNVFIPNGSVKMAPALSSTAPAWPGMIDRTTTKDELMSDAVVGLLILASRLISLRHQPRNAAILNEPAPKPAICR